MLLRQDKFTPFRIPASQVPPADSRPALFEQLGVDERGGYEKIEAANELVLLDSPSLGRIAVPICLDFCGDELTELLTATRANFFLVPAMSQSLGEFRIKARHFGSRNGAATFVVNSAWMLRQIGYSAETLAEQRIVAYLPCRRGECASVEPVPGCESLIRIDASVILAGPAW